MDSDILDVSGPLFLVFYAVFAIVTIVVVRSKAHRRPGAFERQPPPLVDVERDPFEVAYLRGGGGSLLRFAIFELVRRKALRIVMTGKNGKDEAIEATGFAEGNGPGTLLPAIVAFAATPKTSSETLLSGLLAQANAEGKACFEAPLVADGLLTAADEVARVWELIRTGSLLLAAVAIARVLQALSRGHHNIGYLVLETIFAVIALVVAARPQRVTARGRAYLDRIRSAFTPNRIVGVPSIFEPLPILVAAAGYDVLAGTEYASLAPFVRTKSADGSCGGGDSGGDSGGGDGGGGCGGGCGG